MDNPNPGIENNTKTVLTSNKSTTKRQNYSGDLIDKKHVFSLTFGGPCIVIYSYNKTIEMH